MGGFQQNLAGGECPSFLPWPLALTQDLGPGPGLI